MDTPEDNRRRERVAHRTKLTLSLDGGVGLSGYSENVSLNSLLLVPDAPFEGVKVGLHGKIQTEPEHENTAFPCRVARISSHGIGLVVDDDQDSFGMFISHDMMLDLLAGINDFFAHSLNLEETFKTGVERIKDYLNAEAASLFLLENDGRDIICQACAGPVDLTGMRLDPREGIIGRTIRDGQTLVIHDVQNDSRFAARVDKVTGFTTRSILSAPLIIQGRTIGAIEVLNKPGGGLFAGHDRVILAVLASATAMAIQNARNAERFVQAKHDRVTELENQVDEKIARLRDREKREITILDNIADAVVTIDKAARITLFNAAAENMFGYQASELIGKNIAVLLPGEERQAHDGYIANTSLHGPRIINKVRDLEGLRKDQSRFPLELNVSPLKTSDDMGYIGVIRDIGERKAAEEENRRNEERFRDFTSTASDWVWEMGPDLRFTYVSDRFYELFPNAKDTLIGKTRWQYAGRKTIDRDPDTWRRHREVLEQHRPFRNFHYQVGKSAAGRHISLNGNPVFNADGGFAGYRGTGADVTELTEMQENLIRAKEEAETANMAKSEFLSSMSHELRTPLNAILGFGQMLQFNPNEPLSETQQASVDHILKGGAHLLDLINDVLDLAKIEAGKVELSIEDIRPVDIIMECRDLLDEMAEKRHISVSSPDPGRITGLIRADYTRLKQVCLNLMSNAIKYNLEGGSIGIDLAEINPGMLRFSVTDSGPGIALDLQDGLFTAFNRLGAENSDIEGTGIGLVVSRDLVEMMDGTIGFDSAQGKGSTFWFELPLSEPVDADADSSTANDANGGGAVAPLQRVNATLLYVEDNPSNLQLMEMIAARIDGLEMISAHTAELGIDLAASKRPDVIILDINLPGMNGYKALKILQTKDETRDIPVLALSANATRSDIDKGLRAGFLRYLTKPIKVAEIAEAVEFAIEGAAGS